MHATEALFFIYEQRSPPNKTPAQSVTAWGRDLRDAFARLETCEALADLQWRMAVLRGTLHR